MAINNSANNEYVIVYTDNDGIYKAMTCVSEPYTKSDTTFDMEKFVKANPNITVRNVFKANDDIISAENGRQEHFNMWCDYYGFKPEDYGKTIYNYHNGERARIIGLLPRNHKYHVLLQNVITGVRTKATPAFVKKYMEA